MPGYDSHLGHFEAALQQYTQSLYSMSAVSSARGAVGFTIMAI